MRISHELLASLADVRLATPPVAIAFLDEPPPGLPKVERSAAASCAYWKSAAEGQAFYTTAADHANCAIGAYTHGVELTPQQGQELQGLIGTMIELKYLKSEEIPSIPHRPPSLKFAAYAPLGEVPFEADLVVFRGNARQIMLLSEAARAAGIFESGSVMGRPACSMLPWASGAGSAVASIGCIGNRVYTGLDDNEMYLTVPGPRVAEVLSHLRETLTANRELEAFHRQRAAALS